MIFSITNYELRNRYKLKTNDMKRNPLIILFCLFSFTFFSGISNVVAQNEHTGIVWVTPSPDALPVNGNRTGNSGLNMLFDHFHVIEYKFLDSLYIEGYIDKIPVYQIQLHPDLAYLEDYFMRYLFYCYESLIYFIDLPYYHHYYVGDHIVSSNNGEIYIVFYDKPFDQTLVPRSNTRTNNEEMNEILMKYDIKSYNYLPFVTSIGDTLWRYITILVYYQDALPLYYDLLPHQNFYEEIYVFSNLYLPDLIFYPCESYSAVSDEESSSFTIYPNPAQDEIYISGVTPKSVMIYDALGRTVVAEIDVGEHRIDLKHLPNGLYIVKIISEGGKLFTEKVLKY